MADPNDRVETTDTTPPPQHTEGAPLAGGTAPTEKVDLNRLIDDESYGAQILGNAGAGPEEAAEAEEPAEKPAAPAEEKPEAAPAGAAAAAAPAKPVEEEPSIILKNGDQEERVPYSQAANRLQQAGHIQRKWEREVAPVFKVIRQHPELAQALAEAAGGDTKRLQALIKAGTAGPEAAPTEVDPEIFETARQDPRLKHLTDEELTDHILTITALEQASASATSRKASAKDETVQKEVAREVQVYTSALAAANPDTHDETLAIVDDLVGKMRAFVADPKSDPQQRELYRETLRLVNDPRERDSDGNPYYLTLYRDARLEALRLKGAGGDPPAAPPPTKPAGEPPAPRARPVSARLEPGPAGADYSGSASSSVVGLPVLAGKTAEERRAAIDRLLDS